MRDAEWAEDRGEWVEDRGADDQGGSIGDNCLGHLLCRLLIRPLLAQALVVLGPLLGPLLFPAMLYLLGWNEHNYVCENKRILFAEANVKPVGCDANGVSGFSWFGCAVDPSSFTRLSVMDINKGVLTDNVSIPISFVGAEASQHLWMYQCIETKTTTEEKKDDKKKVGYDILVQDGLVVELGVHHPRESALRQDDLRGPRGRWAESPLPGQCGVWEVQQVRGFGSGRHPREQLHHPELDFFRLVGRLPCLPRPVQGQLRGRACGVGVKNHRRSWACDTAACDRHPCAAGCAAAACICRSDIAVVCHSCHTGTVCRSCGTVICDRHTCACGTAACERPTACGDPHQCPGHCLCGAVVPALDRRSVCADHCEHRELEGGRRRE
mmetsp:Transcript_10617/g.28634  ORF Transcript_10617/g.28634 Transcript_10617/m.28634 type:complete len:382 (-) Transcript_10617:705-1850(-)